VRHHRRENAVQPKPNKSFYELVKDKSVGKDAKSNSRLCLTFVSVKTPIAPNTPLPTKFATAEKHTPRHLKRAERITK
jgi:hypothetical protein